MTNSKKNIKDGKNVELDGVIVINEGISLKEKEETKDSKAQEESVSSVLNEESKITPDVKVPEVNTPQADENESKEQLASPTQVEVPQVDLNSVLPNINAISPAGSQAIAGLEPVNSGFNMPNQTETNGQAYEQENPNYALQGYEQDSNIFKNSYDDNLEYERVEATVVTKEDAESAKSAYIDTISKVYDNGPGRQIEILREVAEKAANWIKEADDKGFISGEMHDTAKKIMNQYHGLKEKEDLTDNYKNINEEYNNTPTNEYTDTDFINNFGGFNNAA